MFLDGDPLHGRLVYSEKEYSFRFDDIDEVELAARTTGQGRSSFEIDTLQIEVDTGSGEALFVWGFHSYLVWLDGQCEPDRLKPGVVRFGAPFEFQRGAAIGIADVGEWATVYDHVSGWVRVRSPEAPADERQVLIASGTALGFCGQRLNSVWLHPEFVEPRSSTM